MYKKMAKKVLKKYKGGAIDQIVKDPELKAGGGAIHHPVKAQPEDLVKKKAEGGDVKKDREELRSEVKGMGPEGKAYLRDELKGKKYEGKLKGKYKGDLDKELSGMHARGKEYLKDLVKKSVRREGEGKAPEKKRGRHFVPHLSIAPSTPTHGIRLAQSRSDEHRRPSTRPARAPVSIL